MSPPTSPPAPGPEAVRFLLSHRRRRSGSRQWLEPQQAAGAASLPLLWIPPGRFWMGSPADEPERLDSEGPQHLVQLEGFFLGQTPITQAQWRAVAQWQAGEGEAWGRELDAAPSRFKGDNRPVERVNWFDAQEFCNRLRQRTGKAYRLPSEAQWEYACRAGTSTPYHFGETISPELATYNAEQTTDVGTFPANAWGLHDMHGNVWEWCLDEWHDTYDAAPTDGSAWVDVVGSENIDNDTKSMLLRGGSWYFDPRYCRSAFRYDDRPGNRYSGIGFRVCCLPQDSASLPLNS